MALSLITIPLYNLQIIEKEKIDKKALCIISPNS